MLNGHTLQKEKDISHKTYMILFSVRCSVSLMPKINNQQEANYVTWVFRSLHSMSLWETVKAFALEEKHTPISLSYI